ncbi:hypothetical protein ACIQD1_31285 [Streptomyces sp. NPDC093088]
MNQHRTGRPGTSRIKITLALIGAAISGATRAVISHLLNKIGD